MAVVTASTSEQAIQKSPTQHVKSLVKDLKDRSACTRDAKCRDDGNLKEGLALGDETLADLCW